MVACVFGIVFDSNTTPTNRPFLIIDMNTFRWCLWALLSVIPVTAFAQRTDFDKIVQPTDIRAKDYVELLVQLAWLNNPRHEALESNKHVEEESVKIARLGWVDGITTSFNLNQNAFGQSDNNIFFPTYNLNASFNLGAILKTPLQVKTAKEKVRIAEYLLDQEKLQVRGEVLRRYRDYQYSIELLKLRTQAVEDIYVNYVAIKESFERGTASFRTYMEASQSYNKSLEEKLAAETEVAKNRITLEEIIGVKLEDIDRMERR